MTTRKSYTTLVKELTAAQYVHALINRLEFNLQNKPPKILFHMITPLSIKQATILDEHIQATYENISKVVIYPYTVEIQFK